MKVNIDNIKLLIIDDEQESIERIRRIFTNTFEVVSANSAEQAKKAMAEQNPKIVLCDLFMPKINGFQVCKSIKKEAPNVLFIMVSNHFDYEFRMQSYQNNADEYFDKALSDDEIYLRVVNLAKTICNFSLAAQNSDYGFFSNKVIDVFNEILASSETPLNKIDICITSSKLYTTPRTLQRRLEKEGLTLNSIKQLYLTNHLKKILIKLSINECIEEIGFSSPSHLTTFFKGKNNEQYFFNHAFKRTFNCLRWF